MLNKTAFFIIFFWSVISACKKNNASHITPFASFTVDGDTSHSLTIGPYDQYSLINTSDNADSFIWDFGNGSTSNEKETVLSYPKSGTYTVTLTSINRNGYRSVTSKKVKVVDPVLKQVIVKTLNWNSGFGRPTAWPTFTKADVWVEVVKAEPGKEYTLLPNGTFDAPVIYKTSVASNVDSSVVPIQFDIPQKIIVDIPTLRLQYGYKGRGYGFNLYAQDNSGTYLLSSNFWSGVATNYRGSIPNNKFTISTGILGSSIEFNRNYE